MPVYNERDTLFAIVERVLDAPVELERELIVVDDCSRDGTRDLVDELPRRFPGTTIRVFKHEENQGKGAALRTGLRAAHEAGFDVAVTVDADGQHPPSEALRLLHHDAPEGALVLGIRDLVKAGAPRPNQMSNRISNFFLSRFARTAFADTQCGLRRYPIAATLAADGGADGYAFEAEIILRAKASACRSSRSRSTSSTRRRSCA